jgi:phosphoribosylformimino-5-aminoimidazole carboxamide ribotide isomerase
VILLPAVDIRDGRAVRLQQGDFDRETVYVDDPLEAARSFVDAGATHLHVVDLDGARDGKPANLHHLERIATELEVEVQYGGGLRDLASVGAALAAGAGRVVIGTAAQADPVFLEETIASWPGQVMVAVDVRGGKVSVSGWAREKDLTAAQLIPWLERHGADRFIYTNVDRDGMLEGPDLDELRAISEIVGEGRFLYSGGIGSVEHLSALRALDLPNLGGVISGKALYEGRFGVAEAAGALH